MTSANDGVAGCTRPCKVISGGIAIDITWDGLMGAAAIQLSEFERSGEPGLDA